MPLNCPVCNTNFDSEIWIDGHCPECGLMFRYVECCTEDYSDCWPEVWFANGTPEQLKFEGWSL